jgi:hypothetical protein
MILTDVSSACTPERTRTSDAEFRKLSLYPAELRGHGIQTSKIQDSTAKSNPLQSQSGMTFPGFMIPRGSRADLILRCNSVSFSPSAKCRYRL